MSAMSTKKPVADPDIEPEYDFRDSVPNPYAERYREGHAPLVTRAGGPPGSTTRPRAMLLEYDESVDAAYLALSDAPWHHQVRLDDARCINYAADGSVIGIEILSPRRHGVRLEGLPYPEDITRVVRSVGFRILDRPRQVSVSG
jgi:uncharacterized protein YuzE